MAKILFLSHRVPYPPNKGDKIRAHHILQHLALKHEVWLGALAETEEELSYASHFESRCKASLIVRKGRFESYAGMIRAALTGGALSVGQCANAQLRKWCAEVMTSVRPNLIYVFSSAMVQYVHQQDVAGMILDFVDVDSEKFRQYAAARSGVVRAIFAHEARQLLAFDRRAASLARACLFVSQSESRIFQQRCPEAADKLHFIPNGVDHGYFDPNICADNPSSEAPTITFTGRMDYYPNIDAVTWFAKAMFPRVRASIPDARFRIVGAAPAASVLALAREAGIEVTGAVADIRPYYCQADVVVAPLRIARGIQNKVLEAMAMARPTVVTPAALEGISAIDGEHVLVASEEKEFADAVIAALRGRIAANLGVRARARVIAEHGWNVHLAKLDALIAKISEPSAE